MSVLDDQNLDVASSDTSALDDKAVASTPDDAVSSPATGANETAAPDTLSIVRDVVKEKRADAEVASPAEGEEEKGPDAQAAAEQNDDDWSNVPFNKHPRFQKLLHERNTFKQDATRYTNVVNFIDQAGLSEQEAADGLRVLGMAKVNPVAAWEQIKPWVQSLLVAAGEIIPEDLAQRVNAGELTRDTALEIARANAKAQSVEAAQSFRQQREQERQQTETVNAIRNAAEVWEQDRILKDPNFEAKRVALQKEVLYLQRVEGRPDTPAGVTAQLHKAYKAVNASLPKPAPVPQARPTVRPVVGGQVAGNQSNAEPPKSTLDIVRAYRRPR